MRLLKDLKYARERGVNIKDLLEDLKAERSENISNNLHKSRFAEILTVPDIYHSQKPTNFKLLYSC